jgi:hypothetical protein
MCLFQDMDEIFIDIFYLIMSKGKYMQSKLLHIIKKVLLNQSIFNCSSVNYQVFSEIILIFNIFSIFY